ncbi:AbgT family transporter [Sorangium sp. So ce1078]
MSPELTQAAYRIGDSTTNIIPPLMVYFSRRAHAQSAHIWSSLS